MVLRARLTDPSALLLLVRAIHFTAHASVSISASGLEIATESSHAIQAHAYLYASIFAKYAFTPPDDGTHDDDIPYVCFELNLETLVAALTLVESGLHARHADPVSVELTYDGIGHPLCFATHEGTLQTRFQLRTLDAEPLESLGFDSERMATHVIMPSEWLGHAFQDIEASGEAYVRVRVRAAGGGSSTRRTLVLSTRGTHGSAEIELPDTDQLTEKFESAGPTDNWYPLSCISHMLPALRSSIKASLRTDVHGMLSVQFMIASSRAGSRRSVAASGHAFVEFLCSPLDTEAIPALLD